MNQDTVAQSYDNLAAAYDSEYVSELCKAEERELVRLLDPRIHTAGRILDVGSGTGLLLDLIPSIPNYMGVDLSERMIEQAERKHPTRFFSNEDGWGDLQETAAHVVSLFGSPSYSPILDVIVGVRRHLGYKPDGSTHRHGYGGRFTLMPYARGRIRTAWKYNNSVAAHSNLWYTYNARQWKTYLEIAGATDVVVRGFNLLGSKRLLRLEAPLARRFPDRCQYLFITGVM